VDLRDGPELAGVLVQFGVGVVASAVTVPYLDEDLFLDLTES
jgi:hypothetical protein